MAVPPSSFGAILAGGRSSRFGSDKRQAQLAGIPLVERVRDAMREAVEQLVLVTSDGEPIPGCDLPAIPDLHPSQGPLAGIHAALVRAREEGAAGALIVGCDTPFLAPGLLRALVSRGSSGGAMAVAAESGGRWEIEPLCAWYSCAALPAVEAALAASRLSPHLLLREIGTSHIPLEEVRRYGNPTQLFRNVNTVEELAEAERDLRGS